MVFCFDYGYWMFDDLNKIVIFGYLVIGCVCGFVELCGIFYVFGVVLN